MTVIKSLNRAIEEKNTREVKTSLEKLWKEHFGYKLRGDSLCGVGVKTGMIFLDLTATRDNQTGLVNLSLPNLSVQYPIQNKFSGCSCIHYGNLEEGVVSGIEHREQLSEAYIVRFAAYGNRWPGKPMYFPDQCRLETNVPPIQIREITIEDIKREF